MGPDPLAQVDILGDPSHPDPTPGDEGGGNPARQQVVHVLAGVGDLEMPGRRAAEIQVDVAVHEAGKQGATLSFGAGDAGGSRRLGQGATCTASTATCIDLYHLPARTVVSVLPAWAAAWPRRRRTGWTASSPRSPSGSGPSRFPGVVASCSLGATTCAGACSGSSSTPSPAGCEPSSVCPRASAGPSPSSNDSRPPSDVTTEDVEQVVLEAARLLDESSNSSISFARVVSGAPDQVRNGTRRVFRALDGTSSVGAVASALGCSPLEALYHLEKLERLGAVARCNGSESPSGGIAAATETGRRIRVLVVDDSALMQKVLPPRDLTGSVFSFSVGEEVDRDLLVDFLQEGGYTSSRVQEAVLLLNAAESNEELAQLQIQDKFEELWTQRESLHESIAVLKQALDSSKLFLQSVQSGYEKGIKNQIDIMEAKLKMKSVESELNISHYDMMVNEVGLLDLTGQLMIQNI